MATPNLKVNQLIRKVKKPAKIVQDIFEIKKTISYGFPSKPSAIAHDPKLKLLAIGNQNGYVTIYGAPGVVLTAAHAVSDSPIQQLLFIPNEGRLISVTREPQKSVVNLFEINVKNTQTILELVNSIVFESPLKLVTTCSLSINNEALFIGSENGNINVLDLKTFTLKDPEIIYQDVAMQNVPDDFKIKPGSVEAIVPHLTNEDLILIGYRSGLLILWNHANRVAQGTFFVTCAELESVSWVKDGSKFYTSHSDGIYHLWTIDKQYDDGTQRIKPYGPLDCKPIRKILHKNAKDGEFLIFSGGMQRASHGDKHAISVKKGDDTVVFDFSSKVIDFITLQEDEGDESPYALFVLLEEELVAIDLQANADEKTPLWPVFIKPYLNVASASTLTSFHLIESCPDELYEKIVSKGQDQLLHKVSPHDWPITGGVSTSPIDKEKSVLITGHEDGNVRFWEINNGSFKPILTINTAQYFVPEELPPTEDEGEEIHFRKVGDFDACVDDPRYTITKIAFSTEGLLVVAGCAGQILCFEVDGHTDEIKTVEMKIVNDADFKWKGHHALDVKKDAADFSNGFSINCIVQCEPPAPVTALAVNAEWKLLANGTTHGFGIFDIKEGKVVCTKDTLVANDEAASGEKMGRKKSLKDSIRNSFRRLKKPKDKSAKESPKAAVETAETEKEGENKTEEDKNKEEAAPAEVNGDVKETKEEEPKEETPKTDEEKVQEQNKEETAASPQAETSTSAVASDLDEGKTRLVEARDEDKTLASTVRCVTFANTFLRSSKEHTPSLWAGTHAGTVIAYIIDMPEKREDIAASIAKEIRLHHHAPVVAMYVLDHSGLPLPETLSGKSQGEPDMTGHHELLVCSEEQIKMFSLPNLKGKYKEKLTAHEGIKVRKTNCIRVVQDENEFQLLACLSNLGGVHVYSLPGLFAQHYDKILDPENKVAISQSLLTHDGAGLYLKSNHEFRRFSYIKSAHKFVNCEIALPEGVRPAAPEPVVEEPKEEETKEEPVSAEKKEEKAEETKTEEISDKEKVRTVMLPVENEAQIVLNDTGGAGGIEQELLDKLSESNPEVTVVSTTEYRAVETVTTMSVDDGDKVYKEVTHVRETTVYEDDKLADEFTKKQKDYFVEESTGQTEEDKDEKEEKEDTEKGKVVTESTVLSEVHKGEDGEIETVSHLKDLRQDTYHEDEPPVATTQQSEDVVGEDEVTHHVPETGSTENLIKAEQTTEIECSPSLDASTDEINQTPDPDVSKTNFAEVIDNVDDINSPEITTEVEKHESVPVASIDEDEKSDHDSDSVLEDSTIEKQQTISDIEDNEPVEVKQVAVVESVPAVDKDEENAPAAENDDVAKESSDEKPAEVIDENKENEPLVHDNEERKDEPFVDDSEQQKDEPVGVEQVQDIESKPLDETKTEDTQIDNADIDSPVETKPDQPETHDASEEAGEGDAPQHQDIDSQKLSETLQPEKAEESSKDELAASLESDETPFEKSGSTEPTSVISDYDAPVQNGIESRNEENAVVNGDAKSEEDATVDDVKDYVSEKKGEITETKEVPPPPPETAVQD